jgi:CheY-like chemotaxis protein
VRRRDLQACIASALRRTAFDATGAHQPIITRGTLALEQTQRYCANILVAEDNLTNQQVIRLSLERMGCTVTVVGDGNEAVEACLAQPFDLVLMDVQMPHMDGLEATRNIRRRELSSGHTPIFALTASAMTGDLERCISAGMDGLLTKPLEQSRLRETLDKLGFARVNVDARMTTKTDGASAPAPTPSAAPIDFERLRAAVGNDVQALRQICDTYVSTAFNLVEALSQAVADKDHRALKAAAHSLRGSSTSIFADRVAKPAAELEYSGQDRSPAELQLLVSEARAALDECTVYVRCVVA